MSEVRSLAAGSTLPVAVVIVALLAAFVVLAAIDMSAAVVLAVAALLFGGDLLRELTSALVEGVREPSTDDVDADDTNDDPEDVLERLRARYADGELSDAEFERRLETLLETETVADAERYLAGERGSDRADRDAADLGREVERSAE